LKRKTLFNSISYVDYQNLTITKHPIDAVITWVDTKDNEWIKLKKSIMGIHDNNSHRWADKMSKPDIELEYCLLSICKYMPYIRKIHIVTMRPQIPPCMYTNSIISELYNKGSICIVHHDVIFNQSWKNTVTFNSLFIESFLHNIPNLADHFVYFNDDTYVVNNIPSNTLFHEGKAIQYGHIEYHKRINIQNCSNSDKQLCASNKTHNILVNEYGMVFIPNHQFKCLTKQMIHEAIQYFKEDITMTRTHTIRDKDDVVVDQLFINYGLHNGMAVIGRNDIMKDIFIEAGDMTSSMIIPPNIKRICINNCNSPNCEQMLQLLFSNILS
jgi:hypothetical protein